MFLNRVIDPIADWLLELRAISPGQWLLRGTGTAATLGAIAAAFTGEQGLNIHLGTIVILLACLVALIAQWIDPDADLGSLAPIAILLSLLGRPSPSWGMAVLLGALLLLAHVAWALAAVHPARGELAADAWSRAGRAFALVLAVSVLGGVLVLALSQVQLGAWTMVLAVLAAIGLWAAVMPRAR